MAKKTQDNEEILKRTAGEQDRNAIDLFIS
jgi:hypothetical protein